MKKDHFETKKTILRWKKNAKKGQKSRFWNKKRLKERLKKRLKKTKNNLKRGKKDHFEMKKN